MAGSEEPVANSGGFESERVDRAVHVLVMWKGERKPRTPILPVPICQEGLGLGSTGGIASAAGPPCELGGPSHTVVQGQGISGNIKEGSP